MKSFTGNPILGPTTHVPVQNTNLIPKPYDAAQTHDKFLRFPPRHACNHRSPCPFEEPILKVCSLMETLAHLGWFSVAPVLLQWMEFQQTHF